MRASYRIRRSRKARRLRVEVGAVGIEVVAPEGVEDAAIKRFLTEKEEWIARALRRRDHAEQAHPPVQIVDGGSVPYMGRRLSLSLKEETGRGRPRVTRSGDTLSVVLQAGGDPVEALGSWFRRQARAEISARLDAKGAAYTRLSIRNQKTRWASCSSSGEMSFNWRLLMAPEEVLDYVIDHEIVHLDIPDHSARFWAALADRSPGYEEHERWLRDYGSTLRFP